MYKLLLILRYLRKRRIAWVSLVAVTLCTMMVLVVISVMGGWLDMFRASFHGLNGDILVHTNSLAGFPYYQEMIDQVNQLPEVAAAVPVIHTFGVVKIDGIDPDAVQVYGFPIDDIGKVNKFPESLHLRSQHPSFALDPTLADARRVMVPNPKVDPEKFPGMIIGAGLQGLIGHGPHAERPRALYLSPTRLIVVGVHAGSMMDLSDKTERTYWIVDDSHTGVWQYDNRCIYVPFDVLQRDLGMDAQDIEIDGRPAVEPASTSEIHIKVRPGFSLDAVLPKVQTVVNEVYAKHQLGGDLVVETWEQNQSMWINAIEHEKLLVTFLFAVISIVAIFLVFCIFYMIVVEKTRDIGIIKSVGATDRGVAGIFLGYGLALGVLGAGLGLLLAYLVVHNINQLHHELGVLLHIQIWDPEVYAFDTIPNTMNAGEVAIILAIAIASAVLGALIPAWRAARMDPVESLRWE